MTHRRGVARLAWFLSLLSLATSVVHMAVVRHERCLEHGELVEVHSGHNDAGGQADVAIGTLAFGDQHDEHCPLANTPAATSSLEPARLAADLPAALAATATPAPSVAHPSVATLDVAPKHGPPEQPV